MKHLCICCLNFKCDKKTANNLEKEKAYCSRGMLMNRFGEKKLYIINQQIYKNPKKMESCIAFNDMFSFENNFEHLLDEMTKLEALQLIEAERQDFLKECL